MNREDIIRMAQEAGAIHYWHLSNLERFAALVASAERESLRESFRVVTAAEASAAILHEREACAKLADEWAVNWPHPAKTIALDIRARGNVATNDTSQERVDKTSESVHEPWSPVSIGVDVTTEGAHVVGIYALDNDTSQVFYAKYYPVPQRTWVGLTDVEIDQGLVRTKYAMQTAGAWRDGVEWAVKQLQERNT